MTVNWTPAARQDLRWLDGCVGSRQAALRLQRRIVDFVSLLADHPYLGRVVPEQDIETLRELLVWRYRIWYRVHADGIDVLCIWDGRRGTLPDLLGESPAAYLAASSTWRVKRDALLSADERHVRDPLWPNPQY